jgi:hypothetical protein
MGSSGEAAGDVVRDIGVEEIVKLVRDGAGSGDNLAAVDFADADEIAIRRRNKNLVCGVKIFGAKGLLDDRDARFGSDFEEDTARDTFEAAGIQRRRENLAVFHGENIGGGAFGNFAALVEKDDFVETFFLRFSDGPNILQPRSGLDAGKRRSRVAALFAKSESHRFVILREWRGINNEINFGMLFVALPEADLVVDQINARAAFRDLIGADDFVEIEADFGRSVRHGKVDNGGVFFQASPMALVSEGFAVENAQRSEEPPSADQASLAGRKPHFFDRQQAFVMKNVAVDHSILGVQS